MDTGKGKGRGKGRRRQPRITGWKPQVVAGTEAGLDQGEQDQGEQQPQHPPRLLAGQGKNSRGLTAKMERFAGGVSKGMTLSDAYRQAYDAAGMSNAAIWREASDLMADPRVAARVNQLVAADERDAQHDAARIRRFVIERLHKEAENAENPGARVRALELLGKLDVVGAFRDRVQTEDVTDHDAEQLQALLEERLSSLLRSA